MDDLKLKVSSSPHVRSNVTTSDIMFDVLIALAPATAFGLYQFGVHAAILVAVCIVCCVGFEALYQWGMKKKITVLDFSAAVTGLLLALNLPPSLPIWMAVIGSAFAIIVVKQLFGGLGQNFMNPALAARCFLLLSFSKQMTVFVYDGVSSATPLTCLKAGESVDIGDMFFGFTGGTIGETSALALLIGAAYLLIKRVISPRIPLCYIGTFTVAVAIYGFATMGVSDVSDVGNFVLAHLCGGGLMLGAWFMATDYVTSPITPMGKVVYGICLGLLTFVLRIYGSGAEGVSYAIIISNILVPLIEKVTRPRVFGEGAETSREEKKIKKLQEKVDAKEKEEKSASNEADEKREKMDAKSIAKAIVAIFAITVVMGAALGVVYNITKDPIQDANEKAKQEAYREVSPEADSVELIDGVDYDKVNAALADSKFANDTLDEISFAYDKDKNVIGFIVGVTNKSGYGGDIKMIVGIDIEGKVTGLSFLSINETVGLGMQATEDEFKNQFVDKAVDEFVFTKTGASADNEIDALSGATITTSAVTEGVNVAVFIVNYVLGGGQ